MLSWVFCSSAVGDELGAFAALGRFIGKCILFGDVSGIRFSRGIGQRLVGKHPRAQDLASFDPDLFGKMVSALHCVLMYADSNFMPLTPAENPVVHSKCRRSVRFDVCSLQS